MLTAATALLVFAADFLAVAVAFPVAVLLVEIFAAIVPMREPASHRSSGRRARVTVLVPAHDESAQIRPTVEGVAAQLGVGDRVLVIADNCTDDTASIAAAAGAEVIERHDPTKVGKGYALDCGVRHLRADPPDILIVVDADCGLGAGAIERLASTCRATGRPVQALYLMTAPDHCAVNHRVAEFAWRVKNWVRPLGLHRLGLPCQLMGTGMAFPWPAIDTAGLANGEIVEDLRLGLDFALAGAPPEFCPSAVVTSKFPVSAVGATAQRQRWEHGHLQMIRTFAPRLFWLAVVRRNLGLAALALDLAVPPLAMLALILTGALFFAGAAALLSGSYAGLLLAVADLIGFSATILLTLRWSRDLLPVHPVLSIAFYILAKLPLYRCMLTSGGTPMWIRTDRTK
jgi:cellulose synthase/poly-beta-1,6-N-acetylglucosamine synthase-like glycosyltransferase